MKRTLCIILSVLMLFSAAVVSASAADTGKASTGAGNKIYFDCSGWKNVSIVYCHIWKRGDDAFFGWQAKKEKCTSEGGTKYSYDIDTLSQSTLLSGGLRDDQDYCVIFSANTGRSTYDCTFGKACIGDTLKLADGNMIENPVDSEKKADEAVWTKNGSKFGPHLALTSIGNIVGKFLCPNEKGIEVIGDWLPTYYNYASKYVKPVDALAKAFPKFKIKTTNDIKEVYAYILKKQGTKSEPEMKKILEDAFYKAYPSKKSSNKIDTKAKEEKNQNKNGGHISVDYYAWNMPSKAIKMNIGQSFNIKSGSLVGSKSFRSTNTWVATVNSKGKVTAKNTGTAKIFAKIGSLTFACKVKVRTPKLSKKKLTLTVGNTKKLKVKYYSKKVKWKSSNKKVATVNSKGLVKALKKGKATITAAIKGKKFKCKLTVKKS